MVELKEFLKKGGLKETSFKNMKNLTDTSHLNGSEFNDFIGLIYLDL